MGGRGNGATRNGDGELRVVKGSAFIERNGKYVDQIAALSRRPKEAITDFKRNRTSITITESDGTKTKLTPEVEYNGDAGRKYAANNTEDYSVFTQDSIYKDNKGSHYLVTTEFTSRGTKQFGYYNINVTSRIKKISKLR